MFNFKEIEVMRILEEFNSLYGQYANPELEYYEAQLMRLKENPTHTRFVIGTGYMRMTEINPITYEPKTVTDVYLLGDIYLNRKPMLYTLPFKNDDDMFFEGEAVVSGVRHYIKGESIEVEIIYEINQEYMCRWFRLEHAA